MRHRQLALVALVALPVAFAACQPETPANHNPKVEAIDAVEQAKICARSLGAKVDAGVADREEENFQCAVPIFRVDEMERALEYYQTHLGFHVDWTWGDPAPTFASVSRGNVRVFFCQQCQGNPPAWLTVFVADVDDLYRELSGRGASVVMPPTDEPWGLRELHVEDADGNRFRFATSLDH